ncbi:hypothetical protein SAMN05421862_111138 [Pseudomonas extremaustralis]|nr:hypothetical protein SAMN05421862_111138 [Pseudomonas extremaustralis]
MQGLRKLEYHCNRRVVNPTFYQADIVALHIRIVCQLFLGQPSRLTFLT